MTTYKQAIAALLAPLTGLSESEVEGAITLPQHESHGDFSFPCFPLAKRLRKAPPIIAQEMATALKLPDAFAKVEALSGYLNFFVARTAFTRETLLAIAQQGVNWGETHVGEGKTIALDFSSPNMGKELAFHHLRGTMLGNSLSRIYKARGYQVERINHLGDWGTSYGKLIVMFEREGLTEKDLPTLTIEKLNALYKAFAEASVSDVELENQARQAFQELEAGKPWYQTLWASFRETTLVELRRLYSILDVSFDHFTGEAFFINHVAEVMGQLTQMGLLQKSQGAEIVDLTDSELPPALLRKSDGATLYITRDIAAALYRFKQYQFHKCFYVVDNGQSLHFQQLFAVLKKMGCEFVAGCEHIPFGLVLIKSEEGGWEKGKTRAGASSLLKDVLDAARDKILAIMKEKNAEASSKTDLAMEIAVGALVFSELKNRRSGDIRFEWEQALSFEGDSGPYVQNAHVRLCSILRKAKAPLLPPPGGLDETGLAKLSHPAEQSLVSVLAQLPDRIRAAQEINDPCPLAQFALDVAEKTHGFIHACRVLGSDEERERIFLIQCARLTLRNALYLLGVPAIEEM